MGVVGTPTTTECEPEMTIDSKVQKLAKITFDNAKTPKLTKISPRFGSVLG